MQAQEEETQAQVINDLDVHWSRTEYVQPLYVYPSYPQLPEGYQLRPIFVTEGNFQPIAVENKAIEGTPLLSTKNLEKGEKVKNKQEEDMCMSFFAGFLISFLLNIPGFFLCLFIFGIRGSEMGMKGSLWGVCLSVVVAFMFVILFAASQ